MSKILKCCKCGKPCTIHEVDEYRGEYWGFLAFETMYYSDCCNDDVEEVDDEENS